MSFFKGQSVILTYEDNDGFFVQETAEIVTFFYQRNNLFYVVNTKALNDPNLEIVAADYVSSNPKNLIFGPTRTRYDDFK